MSLETAVKAINEGKTALGIEFGSTRIKSVLINMEHEVLATGSFLWENRYENGLWTYRLEDAVRGLADSYAELKADVMNKYQVKLTKVGAIGISGMMHGYLALDADGNQLAPFLTWRNTNTVKAAGELTKLFQFNIPLRWSIAQLYQAILNQEAHVGSVARITTLAGYMHLLLSGEHVLGVGEASGMFPIDSEKCAFDDEMLDKFQNLVAEKNYPWKIRNILPTVLSAGDDAGTLTETGAKLLDPAGDLEAGIPMAPPEGDAGTGMVATNSVGKGTGNVSAGTSIFSMIVLEKRLSKLYTDIDMVTTPDGSPVAMVHCNNCTSEIDAWVRIFKEFSERAGAPVETGMIYRALFEESLNGAEDCDGVLVYNYPSGEPMVGLTEGRSMVVRRPDSVFSLANFIRSQIYVCFAALSVGMRILENEHVAIRRLTGHGGIFKTPGVAQKYMAAALKSPVTVTETAGEGGPYGMAVLAAYYLQREEGESLESYLDTKVFKNDTSITVEPEESTIEGYKSYIEQFENAIELEEVAVRRI